MSSISTEKYLLNTHFCVCSESVWIVYNGYHICICHYCIKFIHFLVFSLNVKFAVNSSFWRCLGTLCVVLHHVFFVSVTEPQEEFKTKGT
jgi:hypothetical protein